MQRFVFILHIVAFTCFVTGTTSYSLLDFFSWGEDVSDKSIGQQRNEATPKSCICNGPVCMCCVDFNLTYIDLGGPGCVQMKYISQQEGIAVNVSYGDSLIHSQQVKGPNPVPSCMVLLTDFAEICARFQNLLPHEDGLRGCLHLEPMILGDVTASFYIGCFTMGQSGMKLEPQPNVTSETSNPAANQEASNSQSESDELNEEELLAAVNESAKQGLAFFGNLLGLTFDKPETNETDTQTVTPITTPHSNGPQTETSSFRSPKKVKLDILQSKANQIV